MSDLQQKDTSEILKLITDKRAELQKMRFGVTGSGVRNTHAIRTIRRDIARTLTEMNARIRKNT